jgi:hypothetical protein
MLNKADIEKYFIAEKHESLVFLVIGLIAIVIALIFYISTKSPLYKGAAIPLLVLGLVQAVAGYAVYIRSDDQRVSQVYAYDMNPDQLKTTELTRMRKVQTRFQVYQWVEIACIITGLLLFFFFRSNPSAKFWVGFGIALTMMAAELFIADLIAERRAKIYSGLLEEFNRKM